MTANLNIVALSPSPWDGQWVNRQQLLSRLGKKHQVAYSMGAWSVWDRADPQFAAAAWAGRFDRKDDVAVDRPGRNVLRWPRVPTWDAWAIRLHARRLRAAFERRGLVVAYICHPMYWPYVKALRPDFVVYHCYDLYENQPGWSPALDAAERALLAAADLAFSPTTMLSDILISKVSRPVRTLTNAADVQAIFSAVEQKVAIPVDLANIPAPRFGYVGSIHPQLDLAVVAELAQRHPEWHFVLIGPEYKVADLHALPAYQACRQRPNVHLLGERHRSLIPAYLLHMNANLMFYKVGADSWTHVAYPLKLHEYLASGHPVISVELPMVREFAPLVTFVTGLDNWEAALASALSNPGDADMQARRAVAAQHGWETRVRELNAWLDELPQLRAQRLARPVAAPA